jgi:hypothetical protein
MRCDHMQRPAEKVKHARRSIRAAMPADVFHGKAPPSRSALWRASFSARESRTARLHNAVIKRETGPVQGKGRGGACLSVFRYAVSSFVGWAKARSAVPTLFIPLGLTAWASLRSAPPYKFEGSGTPANAGHQPPHQATRRALNGARTLAGVPPRLSPEGIIPSQRLSFRPGFLGRGLNGRYPPSPVPVQGCTSHPGHNAGRHDAQAAREQAANPPAGTALAPMTQCASAPCPSPERGLFGN